MRSKPASLKNRKGINRKKPDHLFVSSSDGSLYDTRKRDWSKLPPLRADYARIFRHIENTAQLRATLRAEAYPSYQTVFHTDDWASLCGACVRKEWRQISPAIREMTVRKNMEDRRSAGLDRLSD